MTVIVDAIQRMSRRGPTAHVYKEGFKGPMPAITHTNAAATIVAIVAVFQVIAPTIHRPPRYVLAGCLRGAGLSVRRISMTDSPPRLLIQTPTALRVPIAQIITSHNGACAAVTETRPERASTVAVSSLFNNQPAESLTGEFDNSHVNNFTALRAYALA